MSSYCGLVDAKKGASNKDLPVSTKPRDYKPHGAELLCAISNNRVRLAQSTEVANVDIYSECRAVGEGRPPTQILSNTLTLFLLGEQIMLNT